VTSPRRIASCALVLVAAVLMTATAAFAATRTVRVADDVFAPKRMTVKAGTTVVWRWVGKNPHNVVVTRGPVRFRSTTKVTGTYRRKLRRRGTYRVVCTIHPRMRMTLTVRRAAARS
jgi:plastocyanin